MANLDSLNINANGSYDQSVLTFDDSNYVFDQNSDEGRRFKTLMSLQLHNGWHYNEAYYFDFFPIQGGSQIIYFTGIGNYGAWKLDIMRGRGGSSDRNRVAATIYGHTYSEGDREHGSGIQVGSQYFISGNDISIGAEFDTQSIDGTSQGGGSMGYSKIPITFTASQDGTNYDINFFLTTVTDNPNCDNFYIVYV